MFQWPRDSAKARESKVEMQFRAEYMLLAMNVRVEIQSETYSNYKGKQYLTFSI